MSRFSVCLAETLRWEGGYSNDPHDPGGATMCGVIQRVYDGWRDQCHMPRRDVRQIERAEIEAIYHRNYWQAVRGDELPLGIDLAVFDFGVNSGPGRAIRHLQRALAVAEDGHIGPATLAAAQAAEAAGRAPQVVAAIMASRRSFLRAIPHFWRFGRGWLRRCDGVELVAGAAALATGVAVSEAVPAPLQDADAQSREQARATPMPAKTGITEAAGVAGGVSTAQLGVETATAMGKLGATGKPWGAYDLILSLAQSTVFWLALTAVVGAGYLIISRQIQKRTA